MLEYVQHYCVPGPGYHSDEKTEAKLEFQRVRTLKAIVAALKEFTGQDFGTDVEQWRACIENNRPTKPQGKQRARTPLSGLLAG
jgi:hypothetical protein